jgi:Mce-associated membrane protein
MTDQQATGVARWQAALSSVAAVLLLAALIFCGASLVSWVGAAGDESVQFAGTRDDVLRIGKQELINFYTLDYKNPDASFDRLAQSATGDLATAIKQGEANWKKQLTDQKTSSTAKVLDAAVTELDDRAGTATVVAIVEVDVTPDNGKPANRLPMQIQLTRTDQGWKLSQAGSIALGSQ